MQQTLTTKEQSALNFYKGELATWENMANSGNMPVMSPRPSLYSVVIQAGLTADSFTRISNVMENEDNAK
ncbi:hypothetical protein [Vibrio phage vB_VmeM-Yong XC32]|nr:hypothetical protein [Vibrio phage vB_VmeM-Yong XC31]QAX96544.1 hypothetical protein [Vibrio phage vB_VmeM-Yong XC32]QAX96862.1 hypothetical protein [Vibrio phage vB_VmeM-Yong MS31]QAX97167.1 hypothetical protein [Vibrio phage vB_VmeM-Yong MS32]